MTTSGTTRPCSTGCRSSTTLGSLKEQPRHRLIPQSRERGCLVLIRSDAKASYAHWRQQRDLDYPLLGTPTLLDRGVFHCHGGPGQPPRLLAPADILPALHVPTSVANMYEPFRRGTSWPSGTYKRIITANDEHVPCILTSYGYAHERWPRTGEKRHGWFMALGTPSGVAPALFWFSTPALAICTGIPRSYWLPGSREVAAHQIGNCVAPPLALRWLWPVAATLRHLRTGDVPVPCLSQLANFLQSTVPEFCHAPIRKSGPLQAPAPWGGTQATGDRWRRTYQRSIRLHEETSTLTLVVGPRQVPVLQP